MRANQAVNSKEGVMVAPENPWRVDVCGNECITCGVSDRLFKIRQTSCNKQDIDWLGAVVAWPDNGRTVQRAAETRLRVLLKKYEYGIRGVTVN